MRNLIYSFLLLASAAVTRADDELPIVQEGFVVDVVAKEPMVSNPCVMAFDRLGRIFVGQGPQYRKPMPETPGDRVDILLDDNGDGVADRRKTFAEGFNSIQGLAWNGRDLWVANAPDLTVVRDLDGDDQADEYIRVYTDLGNLEHGLHGLNFGPDGKLYMSKGNSRGYNRPDRFAPRAFRELWGLPTPEGASDYSPIEFTDRAGYKHAYHTPDDDWGQQGGILRCDPYSLPVGQAASLSLKADKQAGSLLYGRNLEIISRGYRNPWDIAFDDGFDWLGTDNDQTHGDKIFAPFYGAHFGWGHSWSYHWTGEGHLPSVPASAPLFEGSGTGVIYYHAQQFPDEYRDVFFVNDWLRREVYAFRPRWDGALLKCTGGFPGVFAHAGGGRTLPGSSGRAFDPTDIEVGPDGSLYILSWGHAYGATIKDGKQVDVGRVYRIRYAANALAEWKGEHRSRPLVEWSLDQLFADLGSSVPAWRTDAQAELLRRAQNEQGEASLSHALKTTDGLDKSSTASFLLGKLKDDALTKAEQTWILWTLGRLGPNSVAIDTRFLVLAVDADNDENTRIQALRILAHRRRADSHRPTEDAGRGEPPEGTGPAPDGHRKVIRGLLTSENHRIRHETVQLLWQTGARQWASELLDLAARENDRVTFYSTWNALRHLATVEQRKLWLADDRPGVRLAALLGLFEDGAINVDEVLPFRTDSDERVASVVNLWLQKTGGAEPLIVLSPPPGEYVEPVSVTIKTSIPGAVLKYTTDGSVPAKTSRKYGGPISIDRNTTLKVIIEQENTQAGPVTAGDYTFRKVERYRHRTFVTDVEAKAPGKYRMDWTGLAVGKRTYTDRTYHVTELPAELRGLPFLQTCNGHDRSRGEEWLSLTSDSDVNVLLAVDVRVTVPLTWMKIGQSDGFQDTGLTLATTDSTFRVYRKQFPTGKIVLGGSTNEPQTDSPRGMYLVIFDRPLMRTQPSLEPVSEADVLAALETADTERGRELFLHPKGAGCIKCHLMEGVGQKFAPDLSDIGSRVRKPEILIQSILKPSAVITEGFAQQQIVTVQGKVFSGAVLEETGRSLKLINSEGKATTILKADIEERIGTRISPMPDGFGKLMSAQQVADLVAWLMTQKSVGDRAGFSFRDRTDRIDIHFGEQRIATYLKDHPQLTRRALVNVTTPGGIQVTRNFPARAPEDLDPGYRGENGIIHPRMHPGIWMSYGNVDGNDFWRLKAKVVFDGFVEPLTGNRNSGSFAVRNRFMSEDGTRLVCGELTRYRFERVLEGLLLKIDAEYRSDDRDFYFGDQEESGLAIRVASPIRVNGGNGTILNDDGQRNGVAVRGTKARWFDYFGTIDGRQVGIMVVSSPHNPKTTWLHARDYGLVATNPFPMQPRERREPYVKTWVKRGEPFRLSYAVLIHDLPANTPLDHAATAERLLKSFK
ncbi:MAG: PVC-type heme-binding CxxCH protein [Planctomycetota bacterium]|jgi:putative membrane-bound dehydrogenase-like protein